MKNCCCWYWPISLVYKKAPGSFHTGWCSDMKCCCWLSRCLVEHHAHEKHTMSMLRIYGSGWKELSCGSRPLTSSSATPEAVLIPKDYWGQYKVWDSVWLYSPAVSREQAAKFHRPWRGPYRVVKVLLGVTYCIQIVSPNHRDRWRNYRLVVHFNRLKPYHLPENCQPSTPESRYWSSQY